MEICVQDVVLKKKEPERIRKYLLRKKEKMEEEENEKIRKIEEDKQRKIKDKIKYY